MIKSRYVTRDQNEAAGVLILHCSTAELSNLSVDQYILGSGDDEHEGSFSFKLKLTDKDDTLIIEWDNSESNHKYDLLKGLQRERLSVGDYFERVSGKDGTEWDYQITKIS